jgi:hypothetical protein
MIGETQICDRDGTILARLDLEDGEGHVSADIDIAAAPAPSDDLQDRFWIPDMSALTHVAWHGMNAHGALSYRLRHARRGFAWQRWPAGDLPDEIAPAEEAYAPLANDG